MDLQLEGKRALVTGGSRGIGKAIARVLAQEGADVALLARNPQTLSAAAAELAAETGRKVVGISADTTNDEQTRRAVAYIRCAREVVSGMQANGWGRIVNISGLAARQTGNAVGSMRNIAVAALT